MVSPIFGELEKALMSNKDFLDDSGKLIKGKVETAALKMEPKLLSLLLAVPDLKRAFFVDSNGTPVFDKVQFSWVLNDSEFLPDSFTSYKNQIGLIDPDRQFISSSNDVVLSFPYKDCQIEFDSTSDTDDRDEVFVNEVLGKKEIDSLLEKKVFSNAVLHSDKEDQEVTSFTDGNLLIKGNNLISMYSLLPIYRGSVKCMYWDILYNRDSDHVPYYDRFKHSSWLTMMKNRLEVAKDLLKDDGVLLLQCDDNEMAYLKVLCDEIFDRNSFVSMFNIQVRYAEKSLNERSDFQPVIEYVLAYKKSPESVIHPNKPFDEYDLGNFVFEIKEKTPGTDLGLLGGKHVTLFKPGEYEIIKHDEGSLSYLKSTWASGAVLKGNTSGKFFDKQISLRKDVDGIGCLYKVDGIGDDGIGYRYFTGPKKASTTKGLFYAGVPLEKRAAIESGAMAKKFYPITNSYDFSGDFGNCRGEGGVELVGGKKPEILLKTLLDVFTNPGDLVLDAYLGTGTTAAVAMKMGRQFIGLEQLDEHFQKAMTRLHNVIAGDQTGISELVQWKGGGSYISCELLKENQVYVDRIQKSAGSKLDDLYRELMSSPFVLDYKVQTDAVSQIQNEDGFLHLSDDDKKKLLIALLDKNLLYVNYSNRDDETLNVSEKDKAFSKSFYGE
jgi:adenine-specific DNA-methyltransferase